MIDLYTGTPGSGKSLHVASKIKKWVTRGYTVIGNFDIKVKGNGKYGGYIKIENDDLSPEILVYISEQYKERRKRRSKESQILLVIDECQLLFNSREWMKSDRASWLWFFSQHRKLMYDVVLVCQYDMMIDKQIRSLIEYEYIHRKVSNIGMGGKVLSILSGGGLHVAVKVYKPLKEKVGHEFYKARKSIYNMYDTYNMFKFNRESISGGGVEREAIRDSDADTSLY